MWKWRRAPKPYPDGIELDLFHHFPLTEPISLALSLLKLRIWKLELESGVFLAIKDEVEELVAKELPQYEVVWDKYWRGTYFVDGIGLTVKARPDYLDLFITAYFVPSIDILPFQQDQNSAE